MSYPGRSNQFMCSLLCLSSDMVAIIVSHHIRVIIQKIKISFYAQVGKFDTLSLKEVSIFEPQRSFKISKSAQFKLTAGIGLGRKTWN